MNAQINRRDMLKLSAAAALATGMSGLPMARADDVAHFPVCIRDAMLKGMNTPDVWQALRDVGADGMEVNVSFDMSLPTLWHPTNKYTLATPEGVAAFKQELQDNKVKLVTFMMANQLDTRLEGEIAWMKALAPACQTLGAKTIRIDLAPRKKVSKEEYLPIAISACRQIAAIAADSGVRLAVENHGNTTNDPEFLSALFDGVGAANFGQTLDTANFYWYGHPLNNLYDFYERFAPRIFHTHCKSIKYPDEVKNTRRAMGWKYAQYTCPIYEGDIDFARVIGILRKANYTGDLCLENESLQHFTKEQRPDVLKKEIEFLRKLA